jgi:hypothetical protein
MNFGSRLLVALTLVMVLVVNVSAAGEKPPPGHTLVVGTKEAPPFSMKAEDGAWTGISIDLWREIAAEMDLEFEFRETDLQGLLDGVTDRSLDFAVAALTVTSEREKAMDFTHPFFHTGLGIAVAHKPRHPWLNVFRSFFSFDMLKLIVAVFLLSLFIGSFLRVFVRTKEKPKAFRRRHSGGRRLGSLVVCGHHDDRRLWRQDPRHPRGTHVGVPLDACLPRPDRGSHRAYHIESHVDADDVGGQRAG